MSVPAISMIPKDKEHALGEIDDDGNPDSYCRWYRYVCRCGKAGPWREYKSHAHTDHKLHKIDAELRPRGARRTRRTRARFI